MLYFMQIKHLNLVFLEYTQNLIKLFIALLAYILQLHISVINYSVSGPNVLNHLFYD